MCVLPGASQHAVSRQRRAVAFGFGAQVVEVARNSLAVEQHDGANDEK